MDRFSGVNSASRLNQVVDEWAKQQRKAEAVVRERQKRSEELENAQMGSAEDIRKMLEMMEANQKEQAAEIQKNHRVTVFPSWLLLYPLFLARRRFSLRL